MAAVAIANAGMVHMPVSTGSALTSCRTLIAFLDEEDYALKNFALENIVRDPLPPFSFGMLGFLFENSIASFRKGIATRISASYVFTFTTESVMQNNKLCNTCQKFAVL
jgi:hypothetical protein